jgi:hypothetical protein
MGLILSGLYIDLEAEEAFQEEKAFKRPVTRRLARQNQFAFQNETSAQIECYFINGPSGPLTINESGYHYEGPTVSDLKRMVRKEDYKVLCRDFIQNKFLSETLRDCNVLLVARDTKSIFGYIFANETQTGVSIEAICSERGHGTRMMQFFLEYLDFRTPNKNINLHSMPHVLSWYTKFGFELRETCTKEPIHVPNHIWPPKGQVTYEEAYNDPKWLLFMEYLMSKKLNVKKKHCTRPSQLAKHNCADEGFYMNLCKHN